MPALTLPFVHLNLCRNPFGEADAAERASMAVVDTSVWVAHLARPRTAIRFVGAHGRGKSSRLHALRAALCATPRATLPNAIYFRAAREDPPQDVAADAVLLIDEFSQLPHRSASRLLAQTERVVIALHEGERDGLERAGFDVLTVRVAGVTAEQVLRICAARVEWARRGAGAVPEVSRDAAKWLIARYDDDIRAMEACLYDVFQELPVVRVVDRALLQNHAERAGGSD